VRLVAGFPLLRPWFEPGSGHVGFVVDIVTFRRQLYTHHVSPGAGTTIQTVADLPSGLGLTSHQETKNAYNSVAGKYGKEDHWTLKMQMEIC
jgi:hypothetical protein